MNPNEPKQPESDQRAFLRALSWATGVLKRYVEHTLPPAEEEAVETHLRAIDALTEQTGTELTEQQLNASHQRVRQQLFRRLHIADPEQRPARRRLFSRLAVAAAVAAVVVATSLWVITRQPFAPDTTHTLAQAQTVLLQTADTELGSATLPDGTRVYANGGTRVTYIQQRFNRAEREVWIAGEAFFEVTKNPDKPFIIHSNGVQTVVRGTSFNVRAYPEIGEVRVSVRSGKVEVGTGDTPLGILTANKRMVYNAASNQHTITTAPWEEEAAWRQRRLVLQDANITELKLRLKQLYGVDIIEQGALSDTTRFGLSFQPDVPLTDILDAISQLYGIRYTVDSDAKKVQLF